ncbi:putative late blight resistance protein -like protein R1B-16-like [Capsicum annuum]|nr:putative late blight resistance protein -like protein R1B-16-like [Capsicum annuum]KAF3648037.1 putative late blight resistance protein -like protein R1B-16-like [Capsicum annuum]
MEYIKSFTCKDKTHSSVAFSICKASKFLAQRNTVATSLEEDNDHAFFKESSITLLENLKTFRAYRKHVDDRTPRFWWRFPNIEELSCLLIEDLPSCPMFPSVEVHTRILSLDLVVRYMGFGDPVGRDNYLVFPSNLRLLCIGGCFSTKKMILNIARLKNLERLTLKREFPWGKIEYDCWDFTNVEFPALKYLALHC